MRPNHFLLYGERVEEHVFQVMAGAEWLELLCKHIPDRYEQWVRYCGWYSSRSRGARAAKNPVPATASSDLTEALSEYAQRAKAA